MPVSCWMRLSGQPSRPSAMTCCRFSSLKTLLTSMEGNPSIVLNVLPFLLAGFQLSLIGRFWVSPEGNDAALVRPQSGGCPLVASWRSEASALSCQRGCFCAPDQYPRRSCDAGGSLDGNAGYLWQMAADANVGSAFWEIVLC